MLLFVCRIGARLLPIRVPVNATRYFIVPLPFWLSLEFQGDNSV
jgi:hypothetical protein